MAAKSDNSFIMLALLAAGGYYYWLQEQKKATAPWAKQPDPYGNVAPGTAGTFINYAGVVDNVDTAKNQFQTLIDDHFINSNSKGLGLTPYQMDVIYKDYHSSLLPNNVAATVKAEADKVYLQYPGLKV